METILYSVLGVIGTTLTVFAPKFLKYKKLVKELADVYFSYVNMMANGVATDEEKLKFADEAIEAIEVTKAIKT